MLIVDRESGTFQDGFFRDLPAYVRAGDCVVLNESRVIPSRLFGKTESGARVQLFLLKPAGHLKWTALGRPGRRLLPRRRIFFDRDLTAEVLEAHERGQRLITFQGVKDNDELLRLLEDIGHIPLPPYIHRADDFLDRERYQTVFAKERGSVAAPTAGLHFTPAVLDSLHARGAEIARVTLHVGLGTFQPLASEEFTGELLHEEHYHVRSASWQKVESAARVLAVGTTSVRTLETVARNRSLAGETNLFLYPGAEFLKTGAMLTNFHLPKSSLLLLVCAFGGTELMLQAYRHAVEQRYRFFSYGDCMLII